MSRPNPTLVAVCLLISASAARGQTTLRIAVPEGHPEHRTVYVAGSFNDWRPDLEAWTLDRQPDGTYAITLPGSVRGAIQFKFTLGSWDYGEVDDWGADAGNRSFTAPATGVAEYAGAVTAWRFWTWPLRGSTATPSVRVVSYDFAMPQLARSRRIWAYLPPDYETSGKSYPVLYMQDGQLLFDGSLTAYGEMHVDETLDALHAAGDFGVIVIGVEHVQQLRFAEYHPWVNATYGGGEGDEYVDFIVQTLKPYVDAHYRTLPDRSSTGIGGTSAGAHIALYAAVKYPEVFGRVLAFSPSHFLNPEIYDWVGVAGAPADPIRIAISAGRTETSPLPVPPDAFHVSHLAMVDRLTAAGFDMDQIRSEVHGNEVHALSYWDREFAAAYQWIFDGAAVTAREGPPTPGTWALDLYPNPGGPVLNVRTGVRDRRTSIELFDLLGRRVLEQPLLPGDNRLDTGRLPSGLYVVRVGSESRTWVKP